MYKKILVPLDGSKLAERVLPFARRLADSFGAAVELLRVSDPDARPPFSPPQASAQYLKEVSEKYFPASAQVAEVAEVGEPAQVIIDRAKADPACLIAMATHGMSGMRRWLLGSVVAKVVHTAANPLLLVRPADGDPSMPVVLNTIFVPLDGSALAEKALPHVIALGKTMNLEVHLMRVYTLPPDAYVVADGVIAQGPAAFRDSIKNEATTYLEGKIDELRASGLERLVATAIEGDAASEIIDIARKTPNNLIAMSTHGRSGVGRWLLGSVAEKVIQHSQDPVLVIRAA
ncbi:MAG TPA: universal stress protein [Candidatus Deferrimicrobium sp.]|nr:universal stress protein [Candidatus Deferrimicrobium sp.]